ncbi:MAG TPA: putative inorganic carbon transporter subunit DabA, partial [Chroococcales cyanobacterium]
MTATKASETVVKSLPGLSTRENLRELVNRSSAVIAHYWPMTGFVHHNPIRSLESLPFQQAVKVGERLIKGRGYLSNEKYRQLLKSGRIERKKLDAAIEAVARDESVELGERQVSHFEVLRAHLLIGITAPADETVAALVDRAKIDSEDLALVQDDSRKSAGAPVNGKISGAEIGELARRLTAIVEPQDLAGKIGRELTLLTW